MFYIGAAKKDDIQKACKYLNTETKGMILTCYEENEFIGAVCFDIKNGAGIIECLKADKPEMKTVIAKAALNFLELHNIYDVYVYDDYGFYESLGFKPEGDKMKLNLEGYFTSHEKGC